MLYDADRVSIARTQVVDLYTSMQICLVSDIVWRYSSDYNTKYQMEPILEDDLWN